MPTQPTASDSVLVVQLSDSHLFAEEGGRLLGMDTADSLTQVVRLVGEEQPAIDLVLATGDLSQDGSVESYQRFREITASIAAPARWFPGNHDELGPMREAAADTDLLDPVIDLGAWRVILLDSTIPGAVPGQMTVEQIHLLERAIQAAPDKHLLISFHHHPVPIGSRWMDRIGIYNPERLFAVLDRPIRRCAACSGATFTRRSTASAATLRLLASPSTCVQFAPGSEDFSVDRPAPGYRWLRLMADGRVETGVSRVTDIEFEVDYSIKGY